MLFSNPVAETGNKKGVGFYGFASSSFCFYMEIVAAQLSVPVAGIAAVRIALVPARNTPS